MAFPLFVPCLYTTVLPTFQRVSVGLPVAVKRYTTVIRRVSADRCADTCSQLLSLTSIIRNLLLLFLNGLGTLGYTRHGQVQPFALARPEVVPQKTVV